MLIGSSSSRSARRKAAIAAAFCAFALMGAGWYGDEYEQCRRGTTAGIVQCLERVTTGWQTRLDRAYDALLSGQDAPERKAALIDAQRWWAAYREASCAFYREGAGSIAAIEAAECMRVLTKRRARDLEQSAGRQPR